MNALDSNVSRNREREERERGREIGRDRHCEGNLQQKVCKTIHIKVNKQKTNTQNKTSCLNVLV